MAFPITPMRKTTQPQWPVHANPKWLARGLSYCSLNGGVTDIVSGRLGYVTGTKQQVAPLGVVRGFGTTFGAAITDKINTPINAIPDWRTYLAWVFRYGNGGSGYGRIFDQAAGAQPHVLNYDSGLNTFTYNAGYSTGGQWHCGIGVATATGRWDCHTITVDLSAANVPLWYINGTLRSTTQLVSIAGTRPTAGSLLAIGNRISDNSRHWDGMIGPVAIFDSILTAAEIKSLYENTFQLGFGDRRILYFDLSRPKGTMRPTVRV